VLTDRSRALGRLGARYPDVLLALVQGRKSLKFGVITALGYSGDDGLKAVAKEALSQRGSRES